MQIFIVHISFTFVLLSSVMFYHITCTAVCSLTFYYIYSVVYIDVPQYQPYLFPGL